ncbi:10117_t:CDS:2 [Rhizophagus irregularis]|nr:10117_t:CDS:2 [Rhizophagus irregularis]
MSDPVNYNNLRRPKPKSTKGEKTQKKQDRSTDTDDGLFDKSNKKTKIQKFTNDDTYLQTLSKNPSSIINVYSNKTTTQPTIQSTATNYTQELLKLIKIAQSNSSRIKNIMDKQEKFEDKFDKKINEQNTLISDILTRDVEYTVKARYSESRYSEH